VEKAQDVMDKNSMVRHNYVVSEQMKESLQNSQTVVQVKQPENPNIQVEKRNKQYVGKKRDKREKNKDNRREKKFVEEDSGHILDLKG
jgi:hypothetical protein